MTPLAPEPRHSVEALSFLALALALASPSHKGAFGRSKQLPVSKGQDVIGPD
jgi:hypothetical protein